MSNRGEERIFYVRKQSQGPLAKLAEAIMPSRKARYDAVLDKKGNWCEMGDLPSDRSVYVSVEMNGNNYTIPQINKLIDYYLKVEKRAGINGERHDFDFGDSIKDLAALDKERMNNPLLERYRKGLDESPLDGRDRRSAA